MKINRLLTTCAVAALGFFATNCQAPSEQLAPESEVSIADKAALKELGFDVSDLKKRVVTNHLDQSETEASYLVEGDIVIKQSDIAKMLESPIAKLGPNEEQYRTFNLVTRRRTITILGFTGRGFALDNKMRTALRWAVNNYNRLNLDINFELDYGTNFRDYDMVVYNNGESGGGGSAGFPTNGLPFQFVQINAGTSRFSTNVVEHVITHEIGHSVGFRHTDYFDRSFSCGRGGNEGASDVGAVNIPGTPTDIDPNSIMLACFNDGVDGEFGQFDIVALRFLY